MADTLKELEQKAAALKAQQEVLEEITKSEEDRNKQLKLQLEYFQKEKELRVRHGRFVIAPTSKRWIRQLWHQACMIGVPKSLPWGFKQPIVIVCMGSL